MRLVVLLAVVCGVVHCGGPANYGHYTFPPNDNAGFEMEVGHVWSPIVTGATGAAVFSATQMWYTAGPGGYMGTQIWRNDNGSFTHKAIFSCWDASADVQTGSMQIKYSQLSECELRKISAF